MTTESSQNQRPDAARPNGSASHASSAAAAAAAAATEATTETLLQTCLALRKCVLAFLDEDHTDDKVLRSLQGHVRVAMEVIGEALHRYGLEHLSLSYNGGKDCLVLLILILACLPELVPRTDGQTASAPTTSRHSDLSKSLQAIYIVSRDPFPEVEDFVARTAKQYHLDLVRCALPMRQALDAYLSDNPAVEAVFMGTRRTDPHSDTLGHFSPTDPDWPQFMRINPVIDWHYADIWAFIRHLGIPYCSLYDRGFTSLGGTSDTRPNPALAIDAEAGKFQPAYELTRDDEERRGRVR